MAEAIDFSDRYKIWIALCWYAGLRKDEALRLRWEDVDWAGNKLLVNHEGEVTTKRRSRTVRVEPKLMRLLLDAYEWRTTPRVVNCPSNAKVCPALRESLYTLGYVDKGVTLQALRRCRDTIWHQSYPAYVCAEWLGHSEEVARRHYLSIPELYYNEEILCKSTNQTGCQ
jgi:integrase